MPIDPRKEPEESFLFKLLQQYEEGANIRLTEEDFVNLIDRCVADQFVEQASELISIAKQYYPYSVIFLLLEAELYLRTGEDEKLKPVLDQAALLSPDYPEFLLIRAQLYEKQGKLEEALAILDEVAADVQDDPELLGKMYCIQSSIYETQNNEEAAWEALKKALLSDPESETLCESISLMAILFYKREELIPFFKKIIDLAPYNSIAWYELAQVYSYLQYDEEAIEAYEYAFLTNPDLVRAYYKYAELCMEFSLYERALDAFKTVEERFGINDYLCLQLGRSYYYLKQNELAFSYLDKVKTIETDNDELFYLLGDLYAQKKEWSKAVAFFEKAIRLFDVHELYYRSLVQATFELGHFDKTEQAYQSAIKWASDATAVYADYAWFLLEMKRNEAALEAIKEACLLDPDSAELRYSFIACLFAAGQRQQGLHQLQLALMDAADADCSVLFDWNPSLKNDFDVNAVIAAYRG